MRILTLSNCNLRATEGSGQVVLTLADGLRRRGHRVDLIGPDDFEVCKWMRPRANSYRQAVGMWKFLQRQMRRNHYDIVEIYGGPGWLSFYKLRGRQAIGPLLVAHSNGLEPHVQRWLAKTGQARRRWWQVDQSRWMANGFRLADGLIVVSDFDREFAVQEKYQEAERIVTIENGLHEVFLGLPLEVERQPIIGYCGNWIPIKGTALIQSALTQVLREHSQCRLLLLGVGANFRSRDWFPEDVCARIESHPWIDSRERLIKQYRRMSIAILPSLYESFGLAAAEAMACGAAAVLSRRGFGHSLRDGEEALLLAKSEVNLLVSACRRLLADDLLRRRLATAGHRRVQSLCWEKSISKLETTFLGWLAKHERSRQDLQFEVKGSKCG